MHVDITRDWFDLEKHFSRVIFQQGRVRLDAEMDEQSAILLHYLRTAIADVLGPAACPVGASGFSIGLSTDDPPELTISPGRMYVDGLLVENPTSPEPVTYWSQPDGYLDPDADALDSNFFHVLFLRVWERGVTAVEEPSIREVALGDHGPDTAARAKVVWQVAALKLDGDPNADDAAKAFREWVDESFKPRPRMQARAKRPPDADLDVCDVSPTASYRGAENQLYRVEIHQGGVAGAAGASPVARSAAAAPPPSAPPAPTSRTVAAKARSRARTAKATGAPAKVVATSTPGAATFKWSRENGSVVFPIVALSGADVTLATLGRDERQDLELDDWVEIVDDASASRVADDDFVEAPPLFQVKAIDTMARRVTLNTDTSGATAGGYETGADPDLHPLLRRWDHRPGKDADTITVVEDQWIDLEDGIQVSFTAESGKYRRGDYWLIPARVIPGDVIWPQDEDGPLARPPDGVDYHYAPLAHVTPGSGAVTDMRTEFKPLFVT